MIKKIIIHVLSITLVLAGLAYSNEPKSIEDTFRQYIEAAIKSDGNKAVEIFSATGISYWDERLDDAKSIKRNELLKRPVYQVFNVLLIRKRMIDNKAIFNMSGRELLIHSYSMGWNSKKALSTIYQNQKIIDFVSSVEGDTGELRIKYQETILPTAFPFIKENGVWKVDGLKQFLVSEKNTEDKRNQAGVSKEEFCDLLFKTLFGHPVPAALWKPTTKV